MAAEVVVAFRVDSGARLGSGHLVRCLRLANELARRSTRVHFICRELPGHLIEMAERAGFPVSRLPVPCQSSDKQWHEPSLEWLQVSWLQDARETRAMLNGIRPDWLVVDHYGIGAHWQREQRPVVKSILVIDDLADREHDCEVLLDQNYAGPGTGERYAGLVPSRCRRFVGPRYALLSEDYAVLHRLEGIREGNPRRAVVFFGGSDATDETTKTLRALCEPELSHLAVDVVLGPNHPAPEAVEQAVAARTGTSLHRRLESLAGLLLRADVAVGAGGVATWERLCLRLPSAVITVAPNQEPSIAALASEGHVVWIGRANAVSHAELVGGVRRALTQSTAGGLLVDGNGTARVANALVPPSPADLRLYPVRRSDSELLFAWRNDPETRAVSFDQAPISWDTHSRWLQLQLADRRVDLLIGWCGGFPVGQVRLDCREPEAVLSYGVDPDLRGQGFGTALVEQAMRRTPREEQRGCRACVKANNAASRRIFQRLRWQEQEDGDNFVFRWQAPQRTPEEVSQP